MQVNETSTSQLSANSGGVERGLVCAVAIVRDELPFLDEWIAYHRVLGIDHFFLYDDDPLLPLKAFLAPHGHTVSVIDWYREKDQLHRSRQTNAYKDSVRQIGLAYRWVTFLDIDEFIILPGYADLPAFLREYDQYGQISLPWLVFGHNGYFNDPPGLITTALTRRMAQPRSDPTRVKSIVKVSAIARTRTHACRLRRGHDHLYFYDTPIAKGRPNEGASLPHINHYICRSFSRWMRRPERGAVTDANIDRHHGVDWKLSRPGCLSQFVEVIAKDCNEVRDTSLDHFEAPITDYLSTLGVEVGRFHAAKCDAIDWIKPPKAICASDLVVYTAISAGYDVLKEQPSAGIRYVAFLDKPLASATWEIRPLQITSSDGNRTAKIVKVLSHVYFPDTAYTLWIDGSVTLTVSPRVLAEMFLGDFDLVVHRHADRICTYREARDCLRRRVDNPEVIRSQMDRYRVLGFPRNMGLFENIVILRRHNERVRRFNELWWAEIQRGSRRDQLSAVFAASQVGLKVGYFPGCPWASRPNFNGFFHVARHLGDNRWRNAHDAAGGNRP